MNKKQKNEDQIRKERQNVLLTKIGGHLNPNPAAAGPELAALSLRKYAEAFPAKLSSADRKKIKGNYPHATNELIDERSMSIEGVMCVLAMSEHLARIAVDYSPLSHCADDMAKDDDLVPSVGSETGKKIGQAMEDAVQQGMTPFGAACTAILTAALFGQTLGVPAAKLARPLLDALSLISGGQTQGSLNEEEMIQVLMEQMQIGKDAARKYLEDAIIEGGGSQEH